MQKSQKGFTLIELVVVIVLLGILGATALAQFQDLSAEAQNAANEGVASELSSGSSINFASRTLNVANGSAVTTATTCAADAANLMAVVPAYTFALNTNCTGPGTNKTCDVDDGGTAATAVLICID